MIRVFCSGLVLSLLVCGWAPAQEAESQGSASNAELIKQLDAEEFADRQQASEQLAKRGKAAIAELADAARSDSTEVATRALEILRQHHSGNDAETRAAAKDALEKLATGDDALARRAKEILTPKPMSEPPVAGAVPVRPGIRIVGAPRIAIAGGIVGGGKRVTFKETDGVKEIEIVEGDRTTKIDESPDKGIKIKVTDKKDGKEETKEYEAKNADELKEKHPEAHKIYEQHKNGGAEIRIEAFGGDGGVVPLPAGGIRRFDRPAILREPRDVIERIEKAQKQLDDTAAKLKKMADDSANADGIREALEGIEAAKKELEDVKAKIPAPR